jgi:hypothetical protein
LLGFGHSPGQGRDREQFHPHPNHVVEQALAHTIGNAVEAAYRRGNPFTKRVTLMDDWAAYLARSPAQVVPLRPGKSVCIEGELNDHNTDQLSRRFRNREARSR